MPPRRKPKPRPRSKSHVAKRRPKRENIVGAHGQPIFIKFKNMGPMRDFEGNEYKRHYQMETLTSALENQVRGGDRFINSSVKSILGSVPIKTLTFELAQESKYQLIFRVKIMNINRKQLTLGLVVAKNNKEYTELLKKEHALLRILHERVPKCFIEPLKGGLVFLPDRHKRKEHDRELYAYCTEWMPGFQPLSVQKNNNLSLGDPITERFTKAQTQALKRRMVEIVVRSYDPVRRNGMSIPEITSGDFKGTKAAKNTNPLLKVTACRDMENRISPAQLLHKMLESQWEWNKSIYHFTPDDPRELIQALTNALGKADAMDWFSQYYKSVKVKRLPENERFSLYMMDELNIS